MCGLLAKLLQLRKPPPYAQRRARKRYHPVLEAMEDRIVPAPINYWTGQTSSDWTVGTNWSLNHAPLDTEEANFDSTQFNNQTRGNLPCSLSANVNPEAVTFAANVPAATVLTVASAGILQTPELTIYARTAGQGAQPEIQLTGQITVTTDTDYNNAWMFWYGGDIAGSGSITVSAAATGQTTALYAKGSSSSDKPTLGVPLQLNTGDGGGTTTMSFGGAAVQPLVVKGSASITVCSGATLQFDGTPLPNNNSVTAITNGDTAEHDIYADGGEVTSSGANQQVVCMGVDLTAGTLEVDGGGTRGRVLEFALGGTYGMVTKSGSTVNDFGKLAIDQGLDMDSGGTVNIGSSTDTACTLWLGLNANSTTSVMHDGTVNLYGTLVAHGGFDQYLGDFNVLAGTVTNPAQITLDVGGFFTLGGGNFNLNTFEAAVSGNFTANGGYLNDTLNASAYGVLTVSANLDLTGAGCTFNVQNSPPPGAYGVVQCSGTVSGDFNYFSPPWQHTWSNGTLIITVS